MIDIFYIILIPVLIHFLNSIFLKKKLIPNYSGSEHQKFFNNKNTPLTGGIFLFTILILISSNEQIILKICILSFFLIGFFSDINILSSVKWRFFFQSVIIFYFVYYTQNNIQSIRIDFLDIYLQNFFVSCIFTTFCFLILVNGTNFIDGLNGIVILYCLIIIYIIYSLGFSNLIFFENISLLLLIVSLFTLLFLNFYNKLFLGDSGSYLIGFLIGYFLISLHSSNLLISPYFIALLLWYPAFEILFSIIRKLNNKKSPLKPDNNHFHHLLFFYINKNFNLKKNVSNNISSLIINLYNLIIFYIASINIYYSWYQIVLIFLNVAVYAIVYTQLIKFRNVNI